MLNLPGYIAVPSRAVPGYGIVQLDQEYKGLKYASINLDTKGRESLKHGPNGQLAPGCRVVVIDALVGSEALIITNIRRE